MNHDEIAEYIRCEQEDNARARAEFQRTQEDFQRELARLVIGAQVAVSRALVEGAAAANRPIRQITVAM